MIPVGLPLPHVQTGSSYLPPISHDRHLKFGVGGYSAPYGFYPLKNALVQRSCVNSTIIMNGVLLTKNHFIIIDHKITGNGSGFYVGLYSIFTFFSVFHS